MSIHSIYIQKEEDKECGTVHLTDTLGIDIIWIKHIVKQLFHRHLEKNDTIIRSQCCFAKKQILSDEMYVFLYKCLLWYTVDVTYSILWYAVDVVFCDLSKMFDNVS